MEKMINGQMHEKLQIWVPRKQFIDLKLMAVNGRTNVSNIVRGLINNMFAEKEANVSVESNAQ